MARKEKSEAPKKQLIDFFPSGYKPTEIQVHTLKQVQKALDSDKKVIMICAPTGSGKSMISKAIANTTTDPNPLATEMIMDYSVWETNQFGEYTNAEEYSFFPRFGAFGLTITKQLQNQYLDLFSDTKVLTGKSNYQCQVDLNYDVETAPCVFMPSLKRQCWGTNKCHYYVARNNAIASKFAALNYKMFLALPEHVKHREVIVCDEASELEDELVKQFSADIQYSVLKYAGVPHKTLVHDTAGRVQTWLSETLDNAKSVLASLKERGITKLSDSEKIKLKLLLSITSQMSNILDHWNECEYIVEKDVKKVHLTPLKVDKLSRHIFDYADKIVLLSATIIDPHHFARTLGIKDFEYIEVPSTFDAKKSPIYVSRKVSLNHANLKENLPIIAQQIAEILAMHPKEKGLIHTHTLEITTQLQSLLKKNIHYRRLLFREDGVTNKDLLDNHTTSAEPTVLVSPSMQFGVDLKDDLARFQVIVKTPYAPLGSKRVKRLFDEDKTWYLDAMLKVLIQQCGRTTRSAEDHSKTYILDGNAARVVLDNTEKLPKHFIERFC